ncbi:F-box protein PP2-B15-like [Telopea speciosissima]|uniref:F-box protein PP2-B15-like n=1 Tax=Telopea speciosissima TaxID=54955 RepID=UPI001CC708AF|nr:F-box protein PP2-B15-like [Telopea speciosissima]
MRWKSACCLRIRRPTKSDRFWERRLPPDYQDVLSRAVSPLKFKSYEELYTLLCQGILIDGKRKWFSLEEQTGKIRYVISARELYICWSNDEQYFKWKSNMPESRFPEVTELLDVCWLDIVGSIDSCKLSPKTTYGAYLILKFVYNGNYGIDDGLDKQPARISVEVGGTFSSGTAYLRPNRNVHLLRGRLQYLYRMQVLSTNPSESIQQQQEEEEEIKVEEDGSTQRVAKPRVDDDWMEIELGKFFIDGDAGKVEMRLNETGDHWKCGIIIEGIEVRPLD